MEFFFFTGKGKRDYVSAVGSKIWSYAAARLYIYVVIQLHTYMIICVH